MVVKKRAYRRKKQPGSFWKVAGSLVFLAVIVINLYYLWQGDENLGLLLKFQKESKQLRESLVELEKENKELRAFIEQLRNNPDIIEEEARSRLNLIKEGEELYVLPDEKEKSQNSK